MFEHERDILRFWKFPSTVARLVSARSGWVGIGCEVPLHIRPEKNEVNRFHAHGAEARFFGRLSPQVPGANWQPLLSTNEGHPLAWTDSDWHSFLLPFDPEEAVSNLLTERYREADPHAGPLQLLHKCYYRLRPVIPRTVQMRLKHAYTGVQAGLDFPAWPAEPGVEWLRNMFAWCVVRASGQAWLPQISPWPAGFSFSVVLTHDVETEAGVKNIPALADIERRVGVRSSWNLVPERYAFDTRIVSELQRDGFEIGVHGLTHDGRLFESHRTFSRRAVRINEYGRKWAASGFRSPACHRRYKWMKSTALDFDYDSSYPDSDPYQPMPGGCCSVYPWFIGGKVELPITIPQDHVVFDVLKDDTAALWRSKAEYVERAGGMVLAIVHPDYMMSDARLQKYEDFLLYLKSRSGAWFALPREVAQWWRARASATIISDKLGTRIEAGQSNEKEMPPFGIRHLAADPCPGDLITKSPSAVAD